MSDRFPHEQYALIVNFNYLERSLFGSIRAALAPGGLLIFETFTRNPAGRPPSGIRPDFALSHDELLRAFGGEGFEVLGYRAAATSESGEGERRARAGIVAQRTACARATARA